MSAASSCRTCSSHWRRCCSRRWPRPFAARIAPGGETAQTVFVAIAYLVANGVLFVAKFVIYHLFLFGDGAPERVSHIPAVRTMMRSRDLSETEVT